MPSWDPSLYLRFAGERTRPCLDLVARIALADPRRIVDLGCGPGNSTAVLAERWPAADVAGVDSSPEMLAAARRDQPRLRWLEADLATWTADRPFDLVFANAALHWVPDHGRLFPHLFRQVAPGGALAVQMPGNDHSPAHRLLRELAESAAWRGRFPRALNSRAVQELPFYYDLLAPDARAMDPWTTEYLHALAGPEAIVEWLAGTGLRPFLEDLDSGEDRLRFLAQYRAEVTAAYPRQGDGRVLFPFRRLFFVAYR